MILHLEGSESIIGPAVKLIDCRFCVKTKSDVDCIWCKHASPDILCPYIKVDYERVSITSLMARKILLCEHWRPIYEISD